MILVQQVRDPQSSAMDRGRDVVSIPSVQCPSDSKIWSVASSSLRHIKCVREGFSNFKV